VSGLASTRLTSTTAARRSSGATARSRADAIHQSNVANLRAAVAAFDRGFASTTRRIESSSPHCVAVVEDMERKAGEPAAEQDDHDERDGRCRSKPSFVASARVRSK
jgi:hypothetical protein